MVETTHGREQLIADVAAHFEEMSKSSHGVDSRATLRASRGIARVLKTESGRVVTHGEVMASLLSRAAIDAEVVDGKRPDFVMCRECSAPVKVSKSGPLPTKCMVCRGLLCSACRCPRRSAVTEPGMCRACAKSSGKNRSAALKREASMPTEEKSNRSKKGNSSRSSVSRSTNASSASRSLTFEQRSDASKRAWSARRREHGAMALTS